MANRVDRSTADRASSSQSLPRGSVLVPVLRGIVHAVGDFRKGYPSGVAPLSRNQRTCARERDDGSPQHTHPHPQCAKRLAGVNETIGQFGLASRYVAPWLKRGQSTRTAMQVPSWSKEQSSSRERASVEQGGRCPSTTNEAGWREQERDHGCAEPDVR